MSNSGEGERNSSIKSPSVNIEPGALTLQTVEFGSIYGRGKHDTPSDVMGCQRIGRHCMKCDEKAILITRVNDAFCRSCFMEYVVHKFRAAIGKSKVIRHGEKVLVSISGGPTSSAMLHLIQVGLSESTHKKFRFAPGVVFIDEVAVLDLSQKDRLDILQEMKEKLNRTRFPCHITSLEKGINGLHSVLNKVSINVDEAETPNGDDNLTKEAETVKLLEMNVAATESLQKILKSFKSLSAKQEFIRNLRLNLLVDIALKEGYTKVMVGESATRLSVRLLSDIAQGKGSHIPLETHFEDNRCEAISIIRPMKDFSAKEIALYNTLNDIQTTFIPNLTTKAPTNASIEHLTEKFVAGLQAEFPSTVSNIVRTGEKLDMMKNSEDYCLFCKAPLDTNVALASALNAVKFSKSISSKSRKKMHPCDQSSSCCESGDGSCSSLKSSNLPKDEIFTYLCYSCRLSIGELDDLSLLPNFVLENIQKKIRRLIMVAEVWSTQRKPPGNRTSYPHEMYSTGKVKEVEDMCRFFTIMQVKDENGY